LNPSAARWQGDNYEGKVLIVQVAAKQRYSDNRGASNGIEHVPLTEYQSLP
jgi:hypothetical protein